MGQTFFQGWKNKKSLSKIRKEKKEHLHLKRGRPTAHRYNRLLCGNQKILGPGYFDGTDGPHEKKETFLRVGDQKGLLERNAGKRGDSSRGAFKRRKVTTITPKPTRRNKKFTGKGGVLKRRKE